MKKESSGIFTLILLYIISIFIIVTSIDDLINQTYDYLYGDRSYPPTPVVLKGGLLDLDYKVEQ